jgi:hypothetical protein
LALPGLLVVALVCLARVVEARAQGTASEPVLPLAVGNYWSFDYVQDARRTPVPARLEVVAAVRVAAGAATTGNWSRVLDPTGDEYFRVTGAQNVVLSVPNGVDTLLVRTAAGGHAMIRGVSYPGTAACWVTPTDQPWLWRDLASEHRWQVNLRAGPPGLVALVYWYQAVWTARA